MQGKEALTARHPELDYRNISDALLPGLSCIRQNSQKICGPLSSLPERPRLDRERELLHELAHQESERRLHCESCERRTFAH